MLPLVLTVLGSSLSMLEFIKMGDLRRNAFVVIEVLVPIPIVLSFISLVHQKRSVREFCDRTQQIIDQCNFEIALDSLRLSYIYF